MIRFVPLCMLAAAIVLMAPLAAQQPATSPPPDAPPREGRFGVGLQLTWPTFGLSGMMDVSDEVSIQGVLGTAGYGLAIAGRGLFRLPHQEHFRPYAYGEAGLWSAYREWGAVPNFGFGGGIELDIRQFAPEAPPVYASFEAGLNMAFYRDRELGSGSLVRFQIGPAVHYRF
jgi:hypothetical protein